MGQKSKKGSRRLTKKDIREALLCFFESHPQEEFSVQRLFGELHANTHPAKMLTMDVLGELVLDDYLPPTGRAIPHGCPLGRDGRHVRA